MMRQIIASGFTAILIGVTPALAGEVTVSPNKNSADGIGSIALKDSHHGMMPNRSDACISGFPYPQESEFWGRHERRQESRLIDGG